MGLAISRMSIGVLAILTLLPAASAGVAQTLEQALIQAYRNNETLNAERAGLRAADEEVPQALSGYRPRVDLTADVGRRYLDEKGGDGERLKSTTSPRGVGIAASQTVFNGFQTANRVRAAESRVLAARETLRVMEQTVLLDAATAYMDVLRDAAVVELQRRNVDLLQQQVGEMRARLQAGQASPTDLALIEFRLAAARSDLLAAQAAYSSSRANFERIVGTEPSKLTPGQPVDRMSPATLDSAISVGRIEHPAVAAAMYGADVATLQAKIAEGALYPTLTLEGSIKRRYDVMPDQNVNFPATSTDASIITRVLIPLYQGGGEYATIRQSKEIIGQKRLSLEAVRKLARATVIQAWASLNAGKAQVEAAQGQVSAAEIAFDGVRREFSAGQRGVLDLLIAQQDLRNARVAVVRAQRDRVVASYTLLSAVGRLSPQVLSLPTEVYDPSLHYQQVRDSWIGVRAPDGR